MARPAGGGGVAPSIHARWQASAARRRTMFRPPDWLARGVAERGRRPDRDLPLVPVGLPEPEPPSPGSLEPTGTRTLDGLRAREPDPSPPRRGQSGPTGSDP